MGNSVWVVLLSLPSTRIPVDRVVSFPPSVINNIHYSLWQSTFTIQILLVVSYSSVVGKFNNGLSCVPGTCKTNILHPQLFIII